ALVHIARRERARQRGVVAGSDVELTGAAEPAQLTEPAVRQHGELVGQVAGEPLVPGEPGERPHLPDAVYLVEERVDQRLGLRTGLAPPHAVTGVDVRREVEVAHGATRW